MRVHKFEVWRQMCRGSRNKTTNNLLISMRVFLFALISVFSIHYSFFTFCFFFFLFGSLNKQAFAAQVDPFRLAKCKYMCIPINKQGAIQLIEYNRKIRKQCAMYDLIFKYTHTISVLLIEVLHQSFRFIFSTWKLFQIGYKITHFLH